MNRAQSNPNTKGSLKDNDIKENPAFKKYLKLKERQRKLRALRGGIMESTESDELSDIVMDHMSETRSVMSLVSHSQGKYFLPGLIDLNETEVTSMIMFALIEVVLISKATSTAQASLHCPAFLSELLPFNTQVRKLMKSSSS